MEEAECREHYHTCVSCSFGSRTTRPFSFSSKPVHTEAAPSPAEVAAIHTEQVLADKNIQAICLRFDICLQDCSKRKPVVFETGAGSSKMVSY